MSDLSYLIENIKNRAAQIDQAIAQSLANHNALLGQAAEIKNMLDMATGLLDKVAPESTITECVDMADKIVDAVVEVAP